MMSWTLSSWGTEKGSLLLSKLTSSQTGTATESRGSTSGSTQLQISMTTRYYGTLIKWRKYSDFHDYSNVYCYTWIWRGTRNLLILNTSFRKLGVISATCWEMCCFLGQVLRGRNPHQSIREPNKQGSRVPVASDADNSESMGRRGLGDRWGPDQD